MVLKWPNDIYARTKGPKGEVVLQKIGGILVNTVFMAGGVRVVVGQFVTMSLFCETDMLTGCGLNVLNAPPILSLSQLLSKGTQGLTMENMTATIMAIFGQMWEQFVAVSGSFEPFIEDYLDSWIHSYVLSVLVYLLVPNLHIVTSS